MRRTFPAVLLPLLMVASASGLQLVPGGTAHRHRAIQRGSAPPPAPVAAADSYSLGQGSTLTLAAPGVLDNDTTNGASIVSYGATTGTEQAVPGSPTPTSHGGLVTMAADGGFSYTPSAGFTGTDTFSYVIRNGGGSATGAVSLTVSPLPEARNDTFNATRGTTLNVPAAGVLTNDTLNGATLKSYGPSSGAEQPSPGSPTLSSHGGSVILNSDGSFSYTPPSGFTGSDSFLYVIQNGVGSSTATVTLSVQAAAGPDFTVTSPGFFYVFDGISGQNPVITLVRGRTYTFRINTASFHPFEILEAPPGSVSNNNISSGTITFAVPSAPGTYRYHCSVHDFGNQINTVSP